MGVEWILVTVLLGSDPVQVVKRSYGDDSPACKRVVEKIDGDTLITPSGTLLQIKAECKPVRKKCTLLDFCDE